MNLLTRLLPIPVVLMLAVVGLSAQRRAITNEVVASAGGTASTSGILLSWTIGEPIVTTLETNPLIITQGFHQPLDLVSLNGVAAVRVLRAGEVAMYPNPARDHVTFDLPADLAGAAVDIMDESGLVVAHYDLVQRSNYLDCARLANGTYRARLSTPGNGNLIAILPLTVQR